MASVTGMRPRTAPDPRNGLCFWTLVFVSRPKNDNSNSNGALARSSKQPSFSRPSYLRQRLKSENSHWDEAPCDTVATVGHSYLSQTSKMTTAPLPWGPRSSKDLSFFGTSHIRHISRTANSHTVLEINTNIELVVMVALTLKHEYWHEYHYKSILNVFLTVNMNAKI